MAGLGIQKRGTGIARVGLSKGTLPDFNKDGEITKADVLIGRGVIKKAKGGKVQKVMKEFKQGKLHSGKKGPVVKSRKQAIAIALSEAGKSKKK
jgi:hypothetical protein